MSEIRKTIEIYQELEEFFKIKRGINISGDALLLASTQIRKNELFKQAHVIVSTHPSALESIAMDLSEIKNSKI